MAESFNFREAITMIPQLQIQKIIMEKVKLKQDAIKIWKQQGKLYTLTAIYLFF